LLADNLDGLVIRLAAGSLDVDPVRLFAGGTVGISVLLGMAPLGLE
jgi:hypothetical protein